MKIDINDVVGSSKYAGQKLWICDYRKTIDKKAARHVKPTEVFIADKSIFDEAGLDPTIYYSMVGFAQLNKDGTPNLKKLISPFDTTGYRSYSGIGVLVFDNEDECIDAYNDQIQTVLKMYEIEIENAIKRLAAESQEIKNLTIAKKAR